MPPRSGCCLAGSTVPVPLAPRKLRMNHPKSKPTCCPTPEMLSGVRSLEVRWIFPGRLEAAVAGWFGLFPATAESREDIYLMAPELPGLSVKLRGGRALEVKVHRGNAGILEVAGRARGCVESWQKWSFPFSPLSQSSGDLAAWKPVRKSRESACSRWTAAGSWRAAQGPASRRNAEWNSPRSASAARIGGPWGSRRPGPPACSVARSRPLRHSCLPGPCPAGPNPARKNPGPTRSG